MKLQRRGVALYVVILFLMFAAVLSYELQQLMLQQKAQGSLSSQKLVARSVAHSALAVVHAQFAQLLNAAGSPLRALLAAPTAPAAGTDITGALALANQLAAVTSTVPGSTANVAVTLDAATPLHASFPTAALQAGFGLDPLEHRFQARVVIDATYGLANIHWEVLKEVRFQNLVPGVLGKFSLWTETLNPADGNTCKTDFVGNMLPGNQPLVLHNDGLTPADYSFDRSIYLRRGYVYLGGAPELHLTAGYTGFGELFTFLVPADLTQDPPPRVPAFEPRVLPPFFAQQYPAAGATKQLYHLLSMVYGYFNGVDAKGRSLAAFIPAQTNPISSGLHVYGTWVSPSATLVLGNVSRSYCLGSGVLVEVLRPDGAGNFTGDGVDGLVGLLPDLGHPATFPVGAPALTDPCPGLPGSAMAGQNIALEPAPPPLSLTAMFTTAADYEATESTVVVEPYVAGFNGMYRADDVSQSFVPTDPVFTGMQDLFSLQFQLPGRPLEVMFKGLASAIGSVATNPDDPATGLNSILRDRSVYRVRNRDELLEVFSSGGVLSLGAQVILDNPEDVVDLGDLKIAKDGGGVLVLDSKTKLTPSSFAMHGLTTDDDGFGLVLCPLNGDARLDFSASDPYTPWPVSVVAPAGQLVSLGGTVALEGSLVTRKLDLLALRAGGDLYYDTRMDPTGTGYATHYRAYVSDDETSW